MRETKLDILKWGCLLGVELRVASGECGEKAQTYFLVFIRVTWERGEAQQGAGGGP